MADFVPDGAPVENPESSASDVYGKTPPSEGVFGALTQNNPTAGLGRMFDRAQAEQEADPVAAMKMTRRMYGLPTDDADAQQVYANLPKASPVLPADVANERFAPKGVKLFDKDTPESVARVVGQQKTDEMQRNSILNRWAQDTSLPGRLATSAVASIMDPLNDASLFVPGIGEEAFLSGLGRAGFSGASVGTRLAARGLAGASAGAASMVPTEALQYGIAQSEGEDYGFRDALTNLAFGAAVGALGHAGFGALRERGILAPDDLMIHQAEIANAPADLRSDAINTAASQMAAGREVDVEPLFATRNQRPIQTITPENAPEPLPLPSTFAAPETHMAFLKRMGGIQDEGGELTNRGLIRQYPGLVNNKTGMSLDRAREVSAEAGFLGGDTEHAVSNTTVNDFLEALDQHPRYSVHDEEAAGQFQSQEAARAHNERIADVGKDIDAHVAETGGQPIDHEWRVQAAQLLISGEARDADEALERAAMMLYEHDNVKVPDVDRELGAAAKIAKALQQASTATSDPQEQAVLQQHQKRFAALAQMRGQPAEQALPPTLGGPSESPQPPQK